MTLRLAPGFNGSILYQAWIRHVKRNLKDTFLRSSYMTLRLAPGFNGSILYQAWIRHVKRNLKDTFLRYSWQDFM